MMDERHVQLGPNVRGEVRGAKQTGILASNC